MAISKDGSSLNAQILIIQTCNLHGTFEGTVCPHCPPPTGAQARALYESVRAAAEKTGTPDFTLKAEPGDVTHYHAVPVLDIEQLRAFADDLDAVASRWWCLDRRRLNGIATELRTIANSVWGERGERSDGVGGRDADEADGPILQMLSLIGRHGR